MPSSSPDLEAADIPCSSICCVSGVSEVILTQSCSSTMVQPHPNTNPTHHHKGGHGEEVDAVQGRQRIHDEEDDGSADGHGSVCFQGLEDDGLILLQAIDERVRFSWLQRKYQSHPCSTKSNVVWPGAN